MNIEGTVLMMRPEWPRPVCPNPYSGTEHQFVSFGLAFICDGCGDMVALKDSVPLGKWWLYVSLYGGTMVETANKWN